MLLVFKQSAVNHRDVSEHLNLLILVVVDDLILLFGLNDLYEGLHHIFQKTLDVLVKDLIVNRVLEDRKEVVPKQHPHVENQPILFKLQSESKRHLEMPVDLVLDFFHSRVGLVVLWRGFESEGVFVILEELDLGLDQEKVGLDEDCLQLQVFFFLLTYNHEFAYLHAKFEELLFMGYSDQLETEFLLDSSQAPQAFFELQTQLQVLNLFLVNEQHLLENLTQLRDLYPILILLEVFVEHFPNLLQTQKLRSKRFIFAQKLLAKPSLSKLQRYDQIYNFSAFEPIGVVTELQGLLSEFQGVSRLLRLAVHPSNFEKEVDSELIVDRVDLLESFTDLDEGLFKEDFILGVEKRKGQIPELVGRLMVKLWIGQRLALFQGIEEHIYGVLSILHIDFLDLILTELFEVV